jgi:hypothetical protein
VQVGWVTAPRSPSRDYHFIKLGGSTGQSLAGRPSSRIAAAVLGGGRSRATWSWSNVSLSLAVTIALFSAALASMTRIARTRERAHAREPSVVVHLAPPIAAVAPSRVRSMERHQTPAAVASTHPVAIVESAFVREPPLPADSVQKTAPRAEPTPIPTIVVPEPAVATRSMSSPVGVTLGRGARTAAQRDSALAALAIAAAMARNRDPSQAERDEKARRHEPPMSMHASQPEIRGGIGIPFPFLSRGPSAEQRKRDSAIHADNLAILQRLAQRVVQRRDSLRTDSLRRDSIARLTPKPQGRDSLE